MPLGDRAFRSYAANLRWRRANTPWTEAQDFTRLVAKPSLLKG
jgi:hypothetical protein